MCPLATVFTSPFTRGWTGDLGPSVYQTCDDLQSFCKDIHLEISIRTTCQKCHHFYIVLVVMTPNYNARPPPTVASLALWEILKWREGENRSGIGEQPLIGHAFCNVFKGGNAGYESPVLPMLSVHRRHQYALLGLSDSGELHCRLVLLTLQWGPGRNFFNSGHELTDGQYICVLLGC